MRQTTSHVSNVVMHAWWLRALDCIKHILIKYILVKCGEANQPWRSFGELRRDCLCILRSNQYVQSVLGEGGPGWCWEAGSYREGFDLSSRKIKGEFDLGTRCIISSLNTPAFQATKNIYVCNNIHRLCKYMVYVRTSTYKQLQLTGITILQALHLHCTGRT